MLQFTRHVDHRDLKMIDVVWDTVILSALAAFFLVRVIYGYKQYRIARRELIEAKADLAKLRAMDLKRLDASYQENPIRRFRLPMPMLDRVLFSLVVFAGIWIGVRTWMHHFAIAEAVDSYEYSVRNGDVAGACRQASMASSLHEAANDGEQFEKWHDIARGACDK